MFRQLGAKVLDADRITHALMRRGTPVWRRIRTRFGPDILRPSGQIDRSRLGGLVFGHPRRLRELTDIIHPAVRRQMLGAIRRLKQRRPRVKAVVLDVPLLMEARSGYPVDVVGVVVAPIGVVFKRLWGRSGWTRAEVRRRAGHQMKLSLKERRADFTINNKGSRRSTRRQVVRVWEQWVDDMKEKRFHGK